MNKATTRDRVKRDRAKSSTKPLIQDLRQLFGYMSRRRQRQLALLLVLMIVASFSEVVSLGTVVPFLAALSNAEKILQEQQLSFLLQIFSIETTSGLVTLLALTFISAVVLANGLRILAINVQTRIAANISSDISCQLYNTTLLQPYSFHVNSNSSDLINTVTGDAKALTNSVLMPFLELTTNSFVSLALIVGLFLIDAKIALTATVVLGSAYVCIYRLRSSLLVRNSKVMAYNRQQQIMTVQEGLGGIRDVLIGGSQTFFQSAYQRADRPYQNALASNRVIGMTPRYIVEAIAMALIGLLALSLGRNGDFSQAVPILGGLALGANRLLPAIQQSFSAIVKIQGARASLQRILTGLGRPVDSMQTYIPVAGLPLKNKLTFENVGFRYSDDTNWVLKDFNLEIQPRTKVGFVGTTGSGKSTAADLLLGLLKPQQGRICVDGQPLEGERLRQWQKSIAHVPQHIFLTDATIAENIAFGVPKEEIVSDRLYTAARLAQIDAFIRGLPAQYETYVGERGVRLSGGQMQRIGIARALYQQASVIVFDEATSALDNNTEKEVMAAINGLSRQFTIVMIAHRLSTVEECDQIFELHQGKVVRTGTFKDLKLLSPRSKGISS
ncbi:MAG: ABC transporter ATP-binding protein [Phormidesmis sp.]